MDQTTSRDPGSNQISLARELIPVWNFIVVALIATGSIVTYLLFSTDIGRYVTTGSVLGFEGPSYFYVTGFYGFFIAVISVPVILSKLKRVKISMDGIQIKFQERFLFNIKEIEIQVDSIRLILFKAFPGTGTCSWFVISITWMAFIVQLAVANSLLPFSTGFPVVTIGLLIFAGCMMTASIILITRSGIKLIVYDAQAKHVLELPGVKSNTILQQFSAFFNKSFVPFDATEKYRGKYFFFMKLASLGWCTVGIVNLVLVLLSDASVFNQGSAWAILISSLLCLLEIFNVKISFLNSCFVSKKHELISLGDSRQPRVSLMVTSIISLSIQFYFSGKSLIFTSMVSSYSPWHAIFLLTFSILFCCWSIWMSTMQRRKYYLEIDSKLDLMVSAYFTRFCSKEKIMALKTGSWSRQLAFVATIFGFSTFFFILGLLIY
nr:hypothetical protein [Candidatus Sigynarchaeota archaeon]